MNSSQFRKNEFKKLCAIIGFSPSIVQEVLSNLDSYYYEKIEVKKHKKTGKIKKFKDGTPKKRILHPSKGTLKKIQKAIKNRILAIIVLPEVVHGGVKKRSNITNAKPHKGNKYVFTTDLQNFYPNVSYKEVYNSYLKVGFSNYFSHTLTKLTTYKYVLPQGTPTSTHISNLVFLKTDLELIEICKKNDITYTRYVDDLTFSSPHDFGHLIDDLLEIIIGNNFKVNYRKTKYQAKQTVTGINVYLHKIEAPEHIIKLAMMEKSKNTPTKSYTTYIENIEKINRYGSIKKRP